MEAQVCTVLTLPHLMRELKISGWGGRRWHHISRLRGPHPGMGFQGRDGGSASSGSSLASDSILLVCDLLPGLVGWGRVCALLSG